MINLYHGPREVTAFDRFGFDRGKAIDDEAVKS